MNMSYRLLRALPFVLVFTAACQSSALKPGTTLYHNANIITLDPDTPVAGAMAISGDTLLAIGDAADLSAQFPKAGKIDLDGQTVLPGIIDSHVHVRELGMDKIKADLVGSDNVSDMVARLRAHYPDPKPGQWLIGQGWDEGKFASAGYPDRAELDAAFPDNPVALESLHGFAGFYNGAALDIAGIDAESSDPEVGQILRRKTGEPTGVMLTLAQDLIRRHIPAPDQDRLEQAIIAGLTEMAGAGVTAVHEAGMGPDDVAAFQALAERSALPIRVYGMLDGNDENLMQVWFERGILDDPKDWLDIRGIKVFYDGSLGSRTALLAKPYSDRPDLANPTERISPDAVRSLADRAARHGFQMAVHAIGDEGNNRTLGIYEAALADHPDADHRWRIEHAQVVLPDFYQRAAELGVLSSMQPSHAVGDSPWAEDRLGHERIRHAYAWQTIIENGGRVLLNSDLPGEPWTPMETLYFAVNRQSLDGQPANGWYPDQVYTPEAALRGMTGENAYGAFQEEQLGSLSPGKWADFITLNANPLSVPKDELAGITVTGTWVSGKRVE